jgi:hypothetical protein
LFFVVSAAFAVNLFCLGYLIGHPTLVKHENPSPMEKIPFMLANGLLINHLILLLVKSLMVCLLTEGMILGFLVLWYCMRRGGEMRCHRPKNWVPLVFVGLILLVYYLTILCEPLNAWDARSIYFFHAKMVWSAESLGLKAGWDHPSVLFSHVDYPLLVPALAAEICYILGYWNEYAPKLALFLILIPAMFWIFSFYSHRLSFLFLAMMFPFGLHEYLWNGYMDGYLAFYAGISMLLLGRYFREGRSLDLMSAVSCLALLSNIKNEGILLALLGVVSIAITDMYAGTLRRLRLKRGFTLYVICWLILIASPSALWTALYRYQWNVRNDLQLGTADGFRRIFDRLSDGSSFPSILYSTLFHRNGAVWLALLLFSGSLVLFARLKRHINVTFVPSLLTATLYYILVVIIYLSTPNDLYWHLSTSVQRVMLTVSSCTVAGAFLILQEVEDAKANYLGPIGND